MTLQREEGPGGVLARAVVAIEDALPLEVLGAEWASESLTIWGKAWSFSTMSSWRVSDDVGLVASASYRPEAAGPKLAGVNLVGVAVRQGAVADDPVLLFGSGLVLEVMCDLPDEPWVFRLPKTTYVPSEIGDSRW